MDRQDIRLRCVEAAAKNPVPHKDGFAAGVLAAAQLWEAYVLSETGSKPPLGLPKKGP